MRVCEDAPRVAGTDSACSVCNVEYASAIFKLWVQEGVRVAARVAERLIPQNSKEAPQPTMQPLYLPLQVMLGWRCRSLHSVPARAVRSALASSRCYRGLFSPAPCEAPARQRLVVGSILGQPVFKQVSASGTSAVTAALVCATSNSSESFQPFMALSTYRHFELFDVCDVHDDRLARCALAACCREVLFQRC